MKGGRGRVNYPSVSPYPIPSCFFHSEQAFDAQHLPQLFSFQFLTHMFHAHRGWGASTSIVTMPTYSSPAPPSPKESRRSPFLIRRPPWVTVHGQRVTNHNSQVTSHVQGVLSRPQLDYNPRQSLLEVLCVPIEWKFPGMVGNRTGWSASKAAQRL